MAKKKKLNTNFSLSYLLPPIRYTLGAFLFNMILSFPIFSADSQTSLNTEKARENYRIFLQKLKELNTEYKQVTGEMAQVVKEEGVPQWDPGDADRKIGELFAKENKPSAPAQGVTIEESQRELTVTIDMPGVKKDSFKITSRDGKKLIVFAERKTEIEPKKMEKIIDLPSAVDPKGAKASYEDGILTIKLTKISLQETAIPVK